MSKLPNWGHRGLAVLALVSLAALAGCPQTPSPKPKQAFRPQPPPSSSQSPVTPKAPAEPAAPAEPEAEAKPKPPAKPSEPVKGEAQAQEPKPAEKTREKPKPETKPDTRPEAKSETKPTPAPKPDMPKAKADKPQPDQRKEPKPEQKPAQPKPEQPAQTKAPALPEQPVPSPAEGAKPLKKAELLVELPEHCNTPDGMTVLPDMSVVVSVPNFNDQKAAPLLVRVTPDNKLEEFFKLPPHPETGRMGPMGIRVGPSGDLYLADNQLFHGKDGKSLFGKSRLVRIAMKDGKPTKVIPVATGLNVANGLAIHEGYVYVTDTILVPDSKPLISGLFRFRLDEESVQMKTPLETDPHLVLRMESSAVLGFGADGVCFDSRGNLYVNCFEDAVIYKVKLDKDGKVATRELFAQAPFMQSCDGMDYDPRTDKIYVADLMANAVRVVSMDGSVQTLAADGDNDGSGGRLDAPCEALVRGRTIVVANMDFPVPGSVNTKVDRPFTISVIKLD